ncbi:MAG: hypothetical protein KR126chlam4_00311 [Candidatus Anoxychlamydiales bacterium]|nr:hypothetical protein [Candidatus Anoxychlamydiales bacterium]NGX40489.1 hypothetical protein [Candidatus Anoxychlamydiales bacterium]
MRKKRYMSLLEIMIVILLIGVITSVVGFNVKGSLEKGKVFKTEQAIVQIKDLLLLEVAGGTSIEQVVASPVEYLRRSGVPKEPSKFIKDGWGETLIVEATYSNTDIKVSSKKLNNYYARTNKSNPDVVEGENETEELPY